MDSVATKRGKALSPGRREMGALHLGRARNVCDGITTLPARSRSQPMQAGRREPKANSV